MKRQIEVLTGIMMVVAIVGTIFYWLGRAVGLWGPCQ